MALIRNILTVQDFSSTDFDCSSGKMRIKNFISCQDNGDGTISIIDTRYTAGDPEYEVCVLQNGPSPPVVVDNTECTFADPNNPTASEIEDCIQVYITNNPNAPCPYLLTFVGNGTAINPDYVYHVECDGTSINVEDPDQSGISQSSGNEDSDVSLGTAQTIATHDDGLGNLTTINESVTTLTNNGDGTLTFTSEDGTATTFEEGGITCVDNGNGTVTITDASGSSCTFNVGWTELTYNPLNGQVFISYPDGSSDSFITAMSSLVPNLDGSYTHDDGLGNTQDILFEFDKSHIAIDGILDLVNSEGTIVSTLNLCDPGCPPITVTAADDNLNIDFCEILYGYVSTNDTPCSKGVSIWKLVPGSEVNGNAIVGAAGEFQFIVDDCTAGTASFDYIIECEDGTTSQATVTFTITAPVADAVNDSFAMPSEGTLSNTVAPNDTFCSSGDTTFAVNTPPAVGAVTVFPNGNFVYTPSTGFVGTVTWTYDILCNGIPVDTATETITVLKATINDDFFTAYQDVETPVIDATANDIACLPPTSNTTYAWVNGPQPFANGTINPGDTPDSFQYTNDAGYLGVDYAEYEIFCDDGVNPPISFGTATIFMTVTTATPNVDNLFGIEDTPTSHNVGDNDQPCQGAVTTYHLVSDDTADGTGLSEPTRKCNPGQGVGPVEPDVIITEWNQVDGSLEITPSNGWSGSVCFEYFMRCTDANGNTFDSDPIRSVFSILTPEIVMDSECEADPVPFAEGFRWSTLVDDKSVCPNELQRQLIPRPVTGSMPDGVVTYNWSIEYSDFSGVTPKNQSGTGPTYDTAQFITAKYYDDFLNQLASPIVYAQMTVTDESGRVTNYYYRNARSRSVDGCHDGPSQFTSPSVLHGTFFQNSLITSVEVRRFTPEGDVYIINGWASYMYSTETPILDYKVYLNGSLIYSTTDYTDDITVTLSRTYTPGDVIHTIATIDTDIGDPVYINDIITVT